MNASSSQASWKERDAELYGGLPRRYSEYVHKIGAHIVEEIVRLAAPRPGERALDIGAGTGTATVALARALAPGGCVIGIDHSRACCTLATQRTPAGLSIVYRTMDAEAMAFGPASFDLAISFSAIFHFPDPLRALEEMARVVRPGGRLVLSYHSHEPPPDMPVERSTRDWIAPSAIVPFADRWLEEAQHRPVPRWSERGADEQLTGWLEQAGFVIEDRTQVFRDVAWDDPDEFFEAQVMIESGLRTRAHEASESARGELRSSFTRAAREAQRAGARLLYPFGAVCIAARHGASG